MRVAVLTMCTSEMLAVGRLSDPNKRYYCRRHGYEFIPLDRTLDRSRPPQWSKILLLLEHLDRFDWLFWSDADSLVMNPDLRLEDLVDEHPAADLIITRDRNGVGTGEFLVSNRNGTARPFLQAVYDQVQFVMLKPLSDQAAMTRVIEAGLAPVSVGYIPKRRLNADLRDYRPGDFILHFYGQPGRDSLMRKYLPPGAPGPP